LAGLRINGGDLGQVSGCYRIAKRVDLDQGGTGAAAAWFEHDPSNP
jgi:hypothetical protein